MMDRFKNRSQRDDAKEDIGRNDSANPTIGDVIASRFARRDILKGALGTAAMAALPLPALLGDARSARADEAGFSFEEIAAGVDETHHVASGYDADVLIRWGDPVLADAAAFDPLKQNAAAQKKQFGYNNDYLGFLPIDGSSSRGLLVVNHEYTNEELMFPGLGRQDSRDTNFAGMTADLVAIEKAAHGGSVLEVVRENGKWRVVGNSRFARRIDADTAIDISGPAAGHDRLKTAADPAGRRALGMVNNCAGGVTPWGTWLSCEENFHGYFSGRLAEGHREARNFARYGVPANSYGWGRFDARFDVSKEPNEANRFGWVVEIDPFDPTSTPKKRTALGRMKHEGAEGVLNRDGRYVIYTGDDERFDYVYRFVTAARVNTANRAANRDILDSGTLSVARFNADGTLDWLPLVHGQGPLTEANGFATQADVLIEARRAADLLGATKMDRPEDVEAHPRNGKVFVVLTNNSRRKAEQTDPANPRAENRFGHIIEMRAPDADHAADKFRWEMLVQCGDPAKAETQASFAAGTTKDGWFGMPDNVALDPAGRLWVATDGNSASRTGRADGIWAIETDGPQRGRSRHFFRVPVGAEMCGPCFTPDGETLFVAIQHPGEADEDDPKAAPATFENPSTRWPDFKPAMPPRPAVVAITRRGGGRIGG